MLSIRKGQPWIFWPSSICDTFPINPANKLLTGDFTFTIDMDITLLDDSPKQKSIFCLLPCYTGLDVHSDFMVLTVSYKRKTEHYTLPVMLETEEKTNIRFNHIKGNGIYLYINDILVLSENLNGHELGVDSSPHIIFGAGNFPRNNFNLNYTDFDMHKFYVYHENELVAKHDFEKYIFDKSVDLTDNCNFIHKI